MRAQLEADHRPRPTHPELGQHRRQRKRHEHAPNTSARGLGGRFPTKLPNDQARPTIDKIGGVL